MSGAVAMIRNVLLGRVIWKSMRTAAWVHQTKGPSSSVFCLQPPDKWMPREQGNMGNTFCFRHPTISSSSVLGISWATVFCFFSSFHVHCIYILWQGVTYVHHIVTGSLALLFVLNLPITFAFWWYLVLLLEDSKWSTTSHSLHVTYGPVCLFHIPPTKSVLPL